MHLEALVHNPFRGIFANRAAAQDVGCGWHIEQVLAQRAHRETANFLCEGAGDIMPHLHAGADLVGLVWFGHQTAPEEGGEAAADAQFHAVVHVLHDEQDGDVVRPAGQHECAEKINRVAQAPSQRLDHAQRDGIAL